MKGHADFWAMVLGALAIAAMVAWIVLTGTEAPRG